MSESRQTSDEISNAIRNHDLVKLSALCEDPSVGVQRITEAVIEHGNEELLSGFLQNPNFELIDGECTYKSTCSLPVFDYVFKTGSLKCGLWFEKHGVIPTRRQHEELVAKALEKEDVDALQGFLESSEHDRDGEMVKAYLHKAAELSNVNAVKDGFIKMNTLATFSQEDELEEKSVDKVFTDEDGNTSLHVAAMSTSTSAPEVLRLILSRRIDLIEQRNKAGRTPLHVAVVAGQVENAKCLISLGARMIGQDNHEMSIIEDMTKYTPTALEEFNLMLDDGIVRNGSTITLDFSKIYVKDTENSNTDEMMLIEQIAESPFHSTIEHPLIQTFLHDKFRRVKLLYFLFMLLPALLFAIVYSVYCGLLFANLCIPDPDSWNARWNWNDQIECRAQNTTDGTYFSRHELHKVTYVCWVLLIIFVTADLISEVISLFAAKCWKLKKSLVKRYSRWMSILADISIIMVLFNDNLGSDVKLYRWQYHVASVNSFLLWVGMMVLVGKYPKFGIYVQMFVSVFGKVISFFVSYIWLVLAFMMAFMILFSNYRNFNEFPGPLVSVLDMMLGELEFREVYYPSNTHLIKSNQSGIIGDIMLEDKYQQFPGTSLVFLTLFALTFCIVIMNLLVMVTKSMSLVNLKFKVGVAISDINYHMKRGNRMQLIASIDLISKVLSFQDSVVYRYILPDKVKTWFDTYIMVAEDKPIEKVDYADFRDTKYPKALKELLYNYCIRREQEQEEQEEKIREAIQLAHLKELKREMKKIRIALGIKDDSVSKGRGFKKGAGLTKELLSFKK